MTCNCKCSCEEKKKKVKNIDVPIKVKSDLFHKRFKEFCENFYSSVVDNFVGWVPEDDVEAGVKKVESDLAKDLEKILSLKQGEWYRTPI